MRASLDDLGREFRRRFDREAAVAARAPGRVNLIGEHTDYNGGLALPCAIDRAVMVLAAPRGDREVRVWSRETGEQRRFRRGSRARSRDWLDYVAGALAVVEEAGAPPTGCDIAVASDVPLGAGLSSSAALLTALVVAMDRVARLDLDPLTRCRLARRAESDFVGVPCGAMDFLASGLGQAGRLLRIDCRRETATPVAWPAERAALLVADSGERRALADGRYAERRRDCEAALAAARSAGALRAAGAPLCDLGSRALADLAGALPPRVLRRARHVVGENERVAAACTALAAGDLEAVGALLRASMRSLREDFEVSTPALDRQCAVADALSGVHGSRLFGAGFGGCTLHLVDAADADAIAAALAAACEAATGRRTPVWSVAPAAGASVLFDRLG